MAQARFVFCLSLATILCAQESVPIGGRSKQPISAVIDGSDVRKLISEEEKRQDEADRFWRASHTREETIQHVEDLLFHADRVLPGHSAFLEAMSKAPSISVPGKTRAQVLEISKARCLPDASATVTFVRMMIVGKKPPGGAEVWVCTNPYAYALP